MRIKPLACDAAWAKHPGQGWCERVEHKNQKDVLTHDTIKTCLSCESENDHCVSVCVCLCVGMGVNCTDVPQSGRVVIARLQSQLLTVASNRSFASGIFLYLHVRVIVLQVRMSGCLCLAPSCFTVRQLSSVIFLGDKARSCLYLLVSGSRQ